MFGIMIDTGQKFYTVTVHDHKVKVTDLELSC